MQSKSAIPSSLILKMHTLMSAEKHSSGWKLFSTTVHSTVPSLTLMPQRLHEQRPRGCELPGEAEGEGTVLSSKKKTRAQEE